MPKEGGWQSSNQHNKQKSCDSSLTSYLQVPSSPKKIFPENGDHLVTLGYIQIGEGYKKNSKISKAYWDFCHSL